MAYRWLRCPDRRRHIAIVVLKALLLRSYAVREGAGARTAQLIIDHMKNGDRAKEAERLLTDADWLPEPLRLTGADGDGAAEPVDQDGGDEALPAFRTEDDDEEEPAAVEEDEDAMIACK